MPTNAPPTIEDIDRIAARPDPVIRNLQITQCYHELARVLRMRTGDHANWCAFATWASKQAGQSIRKEDLVRALKLALNALPAAPVAASAQHLGAEQDADEVQESIWDVLNPFAPIERVSAAVARGNQKVFEEIGREFARFYATCGADTAFDAARIAQFCEGLRPGEPPDGQRYLRQAFTRYYAALFESDTKARAELMLLANLEIGFHEQTRLQPEIAAAMNAVFVDPKKFKLRLIKALFPYRGWLARFRLWLLNLLGGPTLFDAAVAAVVAEVQRQARLVITEHLMTIGLPHGRLLRLGEDVRGEFPPILQRLTLPDLIALLEQIDPTPDDVRGSGAVDWAALPDRLHFIADLFRCLHASPDLFEPPFSADQTIELKAGRLPAGPL